MSASFNFLFLFVISLYISNVLTDNSEKSDQQTRLDACIKVLKARIAQDRDYFNELVDSLSIDSESNKEEAANKLISLALLNCYKKMSYYDAEEIEVSTKINPFTTDNKKNLDFEKWERLLKSNNKEEIESAFMALEDVTKEIKESKLDLSELQNRPNNPNQGVSDEYDERMQDIYVNRREKNTDLSIFGFNFTTLETNTKYILGLTLIFFVFFAVIFGLKWIEKIRNQSKWEKKKKK